MELRYPFAETPPEGEVREVAPGVNWLRMPLPMVGLDHINLWLLADGEGWTLVDCGLHNTRIRELWEVIFEQALAGRPITRIITTHFHPDHLGLAGWLVERWGAELWMTRTEWLFGRMLSLDAQHAPPQSVVDFYYRAGFGEEALERIRSGGYGHYRKGVTPIPESYRRIRDGEAIEIGGRAWRVVVGRGHAPEHACLYCRELGVMISGDQILPKITPHIGVYPGEPEADPLEEYLESLPRFREIPEGTLVLPSHKDPFVGLHRRLQELIEHHEQRLDRVLGACAEPLTVLETLPHLFNRELDPFMTVMATGESLAHLNYLLEQGRMVREYGADGIYRYRRAATAVDAA
jgi:glyoxylase-like metal-dependent hydrolase (beta-lactamase superfamily II)